jgi:Rrf2 family protein
MFSKACEHGIKAMIYIATQSLSGKRIKIGDVAENTGTPEAYTAKIMGMLTKFNIVNSLKGPYGGFEIDKNQMMRIKVSEIVYAIDGKDIFNVCSLGLSACNDKEPCPMHHQFVTVKRDLRKILENTTLYDLATQFMEGKSILTR